MESFDIIHLTRKQMITAAGRPWFNVQHCCLDGISFSSSLCLSSTWEWPLSFFYPSLQLVSLKQAGLMKKKSKHTSVCSNIHTATCRFLRSILLFGSGLSSRWTIPGLRGIISYLLRTAGVFFAFLSPPSVNRRQFPLYQCCLQSMAISGVTQPCLCVNE